MYYHTLLQRYKVSRHSTKNVKYLDTFRALSMVSSHHVLFCTSTFRRHIDATAPAVAQPLYAIATLETQWAQVSFSIGFAEEVREESYLRDT